MSVEKAKAWLRKAESDLLSADNNLGAAQIPFGVTAVIASRRQKNI